MRLIQENELLRRLTFQKLSQPWAKEKYNRIKPYLADNDRIIDIGAGKCGLSWLLKENNYQVTPLDIQNLSLAKEITPIIYNGEQIPFADKEFDKALLLTVLHHTPEPEQILREAARVAEAIIIIEDVYTNPAQKYLTYLMDSLMNFEFIGHPHTNRRAADWEELFTRLGLELKAKTEAKVLGLFKQVTYYLT